MGRGKQQLKRIEDIKSRHVTFSKRRSGLMKKAKELSVLCDVDVSVFVFSGKGKLYEFSTADSLRKILERGRLRKETDIACGSAHTTEGQIKKGGGTYLLDAVQRYLQELQIEQLDVTQIPPLEHRLDALLHQLRMKKENKPREEEVEIQGPGMMMNEEEDTTAIACDDEFQYQLAQQPGEDNNNNPVVVVEDIEEEEIQNYANLQFYML